MYSLFMFFFFVCVGDCVCFKRGEKSKKNYKIVLQKARIFEYPLPVNNTTCPIIVALIAYKFCMLNVTTIMEQRL